VNDQTVEPDEVDPTSLTLDERAVGLRRYAKGTYPAEAAAELLIAHDSWLRRDDFIRVCTWALWPSHTPGVPFLGVDWETAADFACNTAGSSGELKMLAIAATIAGQPIIECPVWKGFGDLLMSLDNTNVQIVLEAIAHACGWHEQGVAREVTGRAPFRTDPVRSPEDERYYGQGVDSDVLAVLTRRAEEWHAAARVDDAPEVP
jgi:hypothetical protein